MTSRRAGDEANDFVYVSTRKNGKAKQAQRDDGASEDDLDVKRNLIDIDT